MTEYIERDAAVKIAEKYGVNNGSALGRHSGIADCVASALARLPAADVVPERHGHWEGYTHSRYIGTDESGEPVFRAGVVYYCSNPKCRRRTVIKENYCPSCGVKMCGEVMP